MNVSCAICTDLYVNSDADKISVTHCGHVFHTKCLSTWLARANTCPECRHGTTGSNVIRIYFNVSSDRSMLNTTGGVFYNAQLQGEVDNLKSKLLKQDAEGKKQKDQIDHLNKENADIKTKYGKAKDVIGALMKDNGELRDSYLKYYDRVLNLELRNLEIGRLQGLLDDANKKLNAMSQQERRGSQKEAKLLYEDGPFPLASLGTAIKHEPDDLKMESAQLRRTAATWDSAMQTKNPSDILKRLRGLLK